MAQIRTLTSIPAPMRSDRIVSSLSHPLCTVWPMDTCEYCNREITLFSAVAITARGHERIGECDVCGHVVRHVVRSHHLPDTLAS